MTLIEYAEYELLRKRLSILEDKLPDDADWPKIEFALKDVEDIDAVISTLRSITRVYGE
jgi:hypothetical protein